MLWLCLSSRSCRCLSFNWVRISNNWRLIAWWSNDWVCLYLKRYLLLRHLLVLNLNHRKWLDFDCWLRIIELLFADSLFRDRLGGRNWISLRFTLDFRLWLRRILGFSNLLDLDFSRLGRFLPRRLNNWRSHFDWLRLLVVYLLLLWLGRLYLLAFRRLDRLYVLQSDVVLLDSHLWDFERIKGPDVHGLIALYLMLWFHWLGRASLTGRRHEIDGLDDNVDVLSLHLVLLYLLSSCPGYSLYNLTALALTLRAG